MRKIKLFIAMSLDGFVATNDGKVNFIEGDGTNPTFNSLQYYNSFMEEIDTVILGYKTYNQIVTELSVGNYPYKDKKNYVVTSKNIENNEDVTFINDLDLLLKELLNEDGKDIWICGGASIYNHIQKLNLIDEYYITVIPTILGSGIKLFSDLDFEVKLKLIETRNYNGFVDLIYKKR